MTQLLIWPIIVPLLVPPLKYIITRLSGREAFPFLVFVSVLNFLPLFLLFFIIKGNGPVPYTVGGWPFDKGIVLCADMLNVLMLFLVQLVFTLSLFFSYSSIRAGRDRFFTIYFLALAGLNGMLLTTDLFNMYVFLEIVAIVSYGMVAYTRTLQGIEGALKYLVVGTVGSFMILLGIGLVYSVTGSLNLAYLSEIRGTADAIPTNLHRSIFVMFFSGFALKIGIFPFHFWKADAYGAAPEPVSAFLSAAGSKVSIYCLLRIFSTLFGWSFLADIKAYQIITVLGIITIFIGHLMAYRQNMLRRLLAFSSIAHIGYIVVAIGVGTAAGVEGALFHMLNHGMLKAGLFLIAGSIMFIMGTERIEQFKGLHRRAPVLSLSFILLALGMIGLPPVSGFLSKWVIVLSAMQAGCYLSAFSVALAGLLALLYYAKIIKYMFMPGTEYGADSCRPGNKENDSGEKKTDRWAKIPGSQLLPIYFLTIINLLVFIFGSYIFSAIKEAGAALFNNGAYVRAILGGG